MRQKLVRPLLLLGCLPFLFAFVPYAHDGTLAVVVDGEVVRARAVFSTEAADSDSQVVVRAVLPLPSGGEGTLVMVVRLTAVGNQAPTAFTYYEKLSPTDVVFKAQRSEGHVLVGDRYEYGGETSLYLEFDAEFRQGEVVRRLESGWAVTAPSPSILRSTGRLPDGVVVIDDGSGAFTGRAYDRGSVDCYGYPEEVVLVETYHDDFVVVAPNNGGGSEVILDPPDDGLDGVDEPSGNTDDYQIIYDPADNGGYKSDSDGPGCFTDDDSSTSGGDEPAGCGGSGSDPSSDDASSSGCGSSKSDSGGGCTGDAEAARGGAHFVRFQGARRPAWARRVLRVSPLLLALAALLVLPRRRAVGTGV